MRVTLHSKTSLLMKMSRDVSPTGVSVWLFKYPLKSSFESVLHCENFISLLAFPPIYRSKFQLCTIDFLQAFEREGKGSLRRGRNARAGAREEGGKETPARKPFFSPPRLLIMSAKITQL